ncbi:MAG: hypothetical protein ACE366_10105 [Bradymonadia bacterium]
MYAHLKHAISLRPAGVAPVCLEVVAPNAIFTLGRIEETTLLKRGLDTQRRT